MESVLHIANNDALTSIDGLESLTDVGGDLYIERNTTLCQSLVDALVALGWEGATSIDDNADS